MKSPSSQSVSKSVNLANGHQNGHLKILDRQKSRTNKSGRIETTNFHPSNNSKFSREDFCFHFIQRLTKKLRPDFFLLEFCV